MIRDIFCFILVIGLPIIILLLCYLLYIVFQSCCTKDSDKSSHGILIASAPPLTAMYPSLYQYGIPSDGNGYAVIGMPPNSGQLVHGTHATEYAQLVFPSMR